MKRTVKIPKSRLAAPIDFGEAILSRRACGVRLEYEELGFFQIRDKKLVLFDAYSSAHRYAPLDIDCGVIGFPFSLTCNTDMGERVAYCGIRFSEERATEWKLCCGTAALARLARDRDAASVHISSGVCCIADAEAYELYAGHIKDELHPLSGQIILNGQTHKQVELYGKKYAVFSTGWGDGKFRCYYGVADNGAITALIVDFGMIEYPEPKTDELVETDIDIPDDGGYVYDPTISETDNRIARLTAELKAANDAESRLLAYSRRGYAYHSLNNTDAALSDYIAAVNECRNVKDRGAILRAWSVYDNAAEIYCRRSDHESAIALMEAALDVGDNVYSGAFVRLIDLYQLTKRSDKAVEIAKLMIKKRPDDPVANMKYAEVCVASMNYKDAAKAYDTLASDFQLYENLFDEAACLIEINDLRGADAALERHPSKEYSEQYWYYKAYIYYKRRRYTDALKCAERAHDIDPEYMPALYLLIDTHSIMQEYHAVARYAEEYKRLRPDNEYGYSVCAEAQLILGNFSECSRNYGYLYDNVKRDDKYAALAAMTAAHMGDKSRKSKMLRALRRSRSAYYGAAMYALTAAKHKRSDLGRHRVVEQLRNDDDFLLQLAVYLAQTDNVLPATRILDALFGEDKSSFEIVAQQVRIAVRLDDDKLFNRLFDLYIDRYAGKVTDYDKRLISERFKRIGAMRRVDWSAMRVENPAAQDIKNNGGEPLS